MNKEYYLTITRPNFIEVFTDAKRTKRLYLK